MAKNKNVLREMWDFIVRQKSLWIGCAITLSVLVLFVLMLFLVVLAMGGFK